MKNKILLFLLAVSAIISLNVSAQSLPAFPDDPVLNAMQDELQRNFDGLKIPENLRISYSEGLGRLSPPAPESDKFQGAPNAAGRAPRDSAIMPGGPANHPYFVSYTIEIYKTYKAAATFGKLVDEGSSSFSRGEVDLRIGDYSMDNTPEGRWRYRSGGYRANIPAEADYWGLRKSLWWQSDQTFKRAIEQYSRKKMLMKTKKRQEPLDDLSREKPYRFFQPVPEEKLEWDKIKDILKDVSRLFREYPRIDRSQAEALVQFKKHYFVSSEGSANRTFGAFGSINVEMSGLTDNGLMLKDGFSVDYQSGDDRGVLLKKARQEIKRFCDQLAAPPMEDYFGPVLLEGQAAAEFVVQTIVPLMQAERDPVSDYDYADNTSKDLKKWLNKRIIAPHITLIDDPTAETFEKDSLGGHYRVDDEGMPGKRIALIEDGILKTFYMSRSPIEKIYGSNGHLRNGQLMPGNLFLSSSKGLAHKKLLKTLEKLCKEKGNDYGIIIKRLEPQKYSLGYLDATLKAIEAYKYDIKTKKLSLVRNLVLRDVSRRTLRDIYRTGEKPMVYNSRIGGGVESASFSVITPDILLDQIEASGPSEVGSQPPFLKNPFFEK
ncbi:MAG: hypothetical protein KJ620_05905 [Candidatus Edwardsbacteria bacterium]|nr:hypothetical protein [Candidatus Edwardsbacteria bacterium]MBU1575868.1 hypothetical protein [Candidatus Edwardsbacteria bacterium]MBU2464360.1 hypothetical protein [Candidatus Edwardsbacteria bacterium]MBU2593082.1 hypothetical protein [Candidatus Edwardsbacteria bacterium]